MEFIKTGERYHMIWELVVPARGKYLDRMGEVVAIYRDHCLFTVDFYPFAGWGIGWDISDEFPGKRVGAFPLADITFDFESPCIMEAGYDSVQEN